MLKKWKKKKRMMHMRLENYKQGGKVILRALILI